MKTPKLFCKTKDHDVKCHDKKDIEPSIIPENETDKSIKEFIISELSKITGNNIEIFTEYDFDNSCLINNIFELLTGVNLGKYVDSLNQTKDVITKIFSNISFKISDIKFKVNLEYVDTHIDWIFPIIEIKSLEINGVEFKIMKKKTLEVDYDKYIEKYKLDENIHKTGFKLEPNAYLTEIDKYLYEKDYICNSIKLDSIYKKIQDIKNKHKTKCMFLLEYLKNCDYVSDEFNINEFLFDIIFKKEINCILEMDIDYNNIFNGNKKINFNKLIQVFEHDQIKYADLIREEYQI